MNLTCDGCRKATIDVYQVSGIEKLPGLVNFPRMSMGGLREMAKEHGWKSVPPPEGSMDWMDESDGYQDYCPACEVPEQKA